MALLVRNHISKLCKDMICGLLRDFVIFRKFSRNLSLVKTTSIGISNARGQKHINPRPDGPAIDTIEEPVLFNPRAVERVMQGHMSFFLKWPPNR